MGLCDTVCSHLDSDKKIAEKFEAVREKIELLREIKEMKGNVELDSLKQAKQINEHGVYKVGAAVATLLKVDRDSDSDREENAFGVVELKVLDKDGVNVKKDYNLRQLDELQNILMLGKRLNAHKILI